MRSPIVRTAIICAAALAVVLASSCKIDEEEDPDYTGTYVGFINGQNEDFMFVADGSNVVRVDFWYHYSIGGYIHANKWQTGKWPITNDKFTISTTLNGYPFKITGEIDPDAGEAGGMVLFNNVDSYPWGASR
jgi:hypothetical protein